MTAAPVAQHVTRGEIIAAGGAIALLIVMFMDWFGVAGAGGSAWQVFSFVDIVLALCALATLAAIGLPLSGRGGLPFARGRVPYAGGLLAAVLIFAFMVELSSGFALVDLQIGAFLGLLAALAMVAGGYLTLHPDALGG